MKRICKPLYVMSAQQQQYKFELKLFQKIFQKRNKIGTK